MTTATRPSAAARLRGWYRCGGPAAILTGALVTLVALLALPLVAVATDGGVTGPALAASGGVATVLLVLLLLAVLTVAGIGAWLLAAADRAAELRRRWALVALVVVAGALVVVAAGLLVVPALARPASSVLVGAGSWLVLLGLVGAGAGAAVELAAARAASPGGLRIGVSVAVAYATVAALAAGAAVSVVRDGANWSTGPWAVVRGPSASASCVLDPGKDSQGVVNTYEAQKAVDGRLDTAWRCAGNGRGQELRIDLGRWTSIGTVGLLPGYAKFDSQDQTDRYAQNRRIAAVRYTFDGGASVEQRFDTDVGNRSVQTMTVPAVRTRRVTITILGSVEGVTVGKQGLLDRVAISEVRFG